MIRCFTCPLIAESSIRQALNFDGPYKSDVVLKSFGQCGFIKCPTLGDPLEVSLCSRFGVAFAFIWRVYNAQPEYIFAVLQVGTFRYSK